MNVKQVVNYDLLIIGEPTKSSEFFLINKTMQLLSFIVALCLEFGVSLAHWPFFFAQNVIIIRGIETAIPMNILVGRTKGRRWLKKLGIPPLPAVSRVFLTGPFKLSPAKKPVPPQGNFILKGRQTHRGFTVRRLIVRCLSKHFLKKRKKSSEMRRKGFSSSDRPSTNRLEMTRVVRKSSGVCGRRMSSEISHKRAARCRSLNCDGYAPPN